MVMDFSPVSRVGVFAALVALAVLCAISAVTPEAAYAAGSTPWQCWRSDGVDSGFGRKGVASFESADFVLPEYGVTGFQRASRNGDFGVDYRNIRTWPYSTYLGTLSDQVDLRWYDYDLVGTNAEARIKQGEGRSATGDSAAVALYTWQSSGGGDNPTSSSAHYGLEPEEVWKDNGEYMDQRRFNVGNTDKKRITHFEAKWINPANPSGGSVTDLAAVAEDQQAAGYDLVSVTQSRSGGGSRVFQGTIQVPGNTLTTTHSCPAAGTCTFTSSSGVSNISGAFNVVSQNSGEFEQFSVADSSRPAGSGTVQIDVSDTPQVTLDQWAESGREAYSRLGMVDGENDELVVSIRLEREDRSDYTVRMDDERGNFVMRAFGNNPWTYDAYMEELARPTPPAPQEPDRINTRARGAHTVKRAQESDSQWNPGDVLHVGYRQPSITDQFAAMDRPVYTPGAGVGELGNFPTDQILWPVNFEDISWYLFELPGNPEFNDGTGDNRWRYWLSDAGAKKLVESGFAGPGDVLFDREELTSDLVCSLKGTLVSDGITCVNGPADEGTDRFPFPFDKASGGDPAVKNGIIGTVNGPKLVNRGVARPDDAGKSSARRLSEFTFVISEGSGLLAAGAEAGGDAARRLGIPGDSGRAVTFREDWFKRPDGTGDGSPETNPNQSHLLVVAYYEMESLKGQDTEKFHLDIEGFDGRQEIKVPQRKMRRVVCRKVVHPAGFEPTDQDKSLLDRAKALGGKAADVVLNPFRELLAPLGEWVSGLFKGLIDTPGGLGRHVFNAVCTGVEATETFTNGDEANTPQFYVADGDLVQVNRTVESRQRGLESCHTARAAPKATCDPMQVSIGNHCVELLPVRIYVAEADYLSSVKPSAGLDDQWKYSRSYTEYSRVIGQNLKGVSDPSSRSVTVDPDTRYIDPLPLYSEVSDSYAARQAILDHRNIGLTEVELRWEFVGGADKSYLTDAVDGYQVCVLPDEAVNPAPGKNVLCFKLPLYYEGLTEAVVGDTDPPDYDKVVRRLDRFRVGGLDGNPAFVDGSNGVDFRKQYAADYTYAEGKAKAAAVTRVPHGNTTQRADYGAFAKLLGQLPLAPGYTHSFSVAPYVGVPGETNFVLGPQSDWMKLNGNSIACLATGTPIGYPGEDAEWGTADDPPASPGDDGLFGTTDDEGRSSNNRGWANLAAIQTEVYGCEGSDLPGAEVVGGTTVDPIFGLLSLSVPDRCKDVFTATPAGYTWGNAAVRDGWNFMWILAGMVLFTLLVWHGLKMTYDIWIEPRPDFGLREALPRFLIAIVLAAGSLYLCQLALVLVADVTCYVSERTSVTMWSFIFDLAGRFAEGTLALLAGMVSDLDWSWKSLGNILSLIVIYLFLWAIILCALIFVLILFVKLWFIMLTRIALLAVLIMFSPLAFAMYASPATAHWTKRWVTLFMGTALQQAVILIVIYLGSFIMLGFAESGVSLDIGGWVTMAAATVLILALALKVPDIINPGAKGLFAAAGEMLKMAAAATVLVASAGAGLAIGGAGAMAAARGAGGAAGATGSLGATGAASSVGTSSAGAAGEAGTAGVAGGGGGAGGPGPGANVNAGSWHGRMGQRFAGSEAGDYSQTTTSVRRGMMHGLQRGVRNAQRFNIRAMDVTSGRGLFQGFSHGDDRAIAEERKQEQQALENSAKAMRARASREARRGGESSPNAAY